MKIAYIELRGEQHPLCYNLYAIERLCDEFGSLEKMSEDISGETAEQLRAVGKVLRILLDGGRAYCKEMGIDLPPKVENPAALIDITDKKIFEAIFEAIRGNQETEIEVNSKNVEAAQGN